MKLPNATLIAMKPIAVAVASPTPSCTSASNTAGTAAMIEPMVGM